MQLNIVLAIDDLFIDTSGSEDWDNGRTFACRTLSILSSFTFCLQWLQGTTATTTVINLYTIQGYLFLHHTHTRALSLSNSLAHTHTLNVMLYKRMPRIVERRRELSRH